MATGVVLWVLSNSEVNHFGMKAIQKSLFKKGHELKSIISQRLTNRQEGKSHYSWNSEEKKKQPFWSLVTQDLVIRHTVLVVSMWKCLRKNKNTKMNFKKATLSNEQKIIQRGSYENGKYNCWKTSTDRVSSRICTIEELMSNSVGISGM